MFSSQKSSASYKKVLVFIAPIFFITNHIMPFCAIANLTILSLGGKKLP